MRVSFCVCFFVLCMCCFFWFQLTAQVQFTARKGSSLKQPIMFRLRRKTILTHWVVGGQLPSLAVLAETLINTLEWRLLSEQYRLTHTGVIDDVTDVQAVDAVAAQSKARAWIQSNKIVLESQRDIKIRSYLVSALKQPTPSSKINKWIRSNVNSVNFVNIYRS